MPAYLKCSCDHCGGRIEYPTEAVGAKAPCPHCKRETRLKLDGGDDADVLTVGGKKTQWVIGTVVVCVTAIALLVGAGIWVKKRGAAKATTGGKSQGVANSPPPPVVNLLAKVELDLPKRVVPVVGKFQNGLTAAQIKNGREIIGGACTDCHRQFDPATYGSAEWDRIVGTMRGKAKLRPKESDELDTFVRSVRN